MQYIEHTDIANVEFVGFQRNLEGFNNQVFRIDRVDGRRVYVLTEWIPCDLGTRFQTTELGWNLDISATPEDIVEARRCFFGENAQTDSFAIQLTQTKERYQRSFLRNYHLNIPSQILWLDTRKD